MRTEQFILLYCIYSLPVSGIKLIVTYMQVTEQPVKIAINKRRIKELL